MKGISSEAISAAIQQAEANQLAADVMPAVQDVTLPPTLHDRLPHGDDGFVGLGGLTPKVLRRGALGVGVLFGVCGVVFGDSSFGISNPGVASLKKVEVHPGNYCNADFIAGVKNVQARVSKDIRFAPDPWITETMSGDVEAEVCLHMGSLATAEKAKDGLNKGKFVLNVHASSDPANSDFELIMYKPNPAEITFKKNEGYINKLGDFVFSSINLIPLWNVQPGDSAEHKLQALAELQSYNLVSRTCGQMALEKLQEKGTPGGTMGEQLAKDASSFAKNFLHDKNATINPSDLALNITYDKQNPGIATQYDFSGVMKKTQKETKGLSWPKAKDMPKCGDAIQGDKPKAKQQAGDPTK